MVTNPYFDMKEMETIKDEEKRTIDGNEVKNTIHIGNKEILFAENLTKSEPYMVCSCKWDNSLGIDVYAETAICMDYLEAITEFLDRASSQIQHVRDQRAEATNALLPWVLGSDV